MCIRDRAYTDKWFKANIGEEVIISSKKIEVDEPNQSEIKRAEAKASYEKRVAVVDNYKDDLSFNPYITNESFNKIKSFAGQLSIGLADAIEPQIEEKNGKEKVKGFTVKFLDGKGSALVTPGMSNKKVREILKRAMIGGQYFYEKEPNDKPVRTWTP